VRSSTTALAATTPLWPRQVEPPPDDLSSPAPAQAELLEAAARCGQAPLGREALEQIALRAHASGTDWALGSHARSRALLSDGEIAERLYRDAIERLRRTRVRVELACAHLVCGEWLHAERRRSEGRDQLRTARAMFTAMGVEAFARRAGRELSATGERVARRTVGSQEGLTPQEAQIARLAR
jgi:hypothetical protein